MFNSDVYLFKNISSTLYLDTAVVKSTFAIDSCMLQVDYLYITMNELLITIDLEIIKFNTSRNNKKGK